MASVMRAETRDPEIEALTGGRDDAFIAELARVGWPVLQRYFGAEVVGTERIPEGGALYVGNHSGGMASPDSWLFGSALVRERGMGAVPWALGHDMVFRLPALGGLMRRLGAVPARPDAAERILASGRKVLVYPGGDVDAMRPWNARHTIRFGGRTGYARTAIRAGVPIVPVLAVGAHSGFVLFGDLEPMLRRAGVARWMRMKTWPLGISFPWGLTVGPPPPYLPAPSRILIEILDPIAPPDGGAEAAADRDAVRALDRAVRGALEDALPRLLERRRQLGPIAVRDWLRG